MRKFSGTLTFFSLIACFWSCAAAVGHGAGQLKDCGEKFCNWDAAMAYCKREGSRLPTLEELKQMRAAECAEGRTSGLCEGWYWSSREKGAKFAFSLDFADGSASAYGKSVGTIVLCAPRTVSQQKRSAAAGGPRKNEKSAKGAALPVTGAAAQGGAPRGNPGNCRGGSCKWEDAVAYCNGRMPNVAQLQSMYRDECTGEVKGETCNNWYWSSEESDAGSARGVNFIYGGAVENGHKKDGVHVRCLP